MKIRCIIPIATLLLFGGCTDDPVEPESSKGSDLHRSFALTVPIRTAQDRLAMSGIDPSGRIVVGTSRFGVNWWDPGVPTRWSPGYGITPIGEPPIAGITAYGHFAVNGQYVSAANVFAGSDCHAVYWRERGARATPGTGTGVITRHVLPLAPVANGCLQVQAITDVNGTFPHGLGPFTVIGFAGTQGAERAYRFDVSATDVVTITELPGPPATAAVAHFTKAYDVNGPAAMIVGSYWTAATGRRVASWSLADNSVTDWNIPGEAFGVNSSGTVVGTNIGVTNQGFVSTGPDNSTEIIVGTTGTFMTDISDTGLMIGDAHTPGVSVAGFVLRRENLGMLPGMEFKGISNGGAIVGLSNSEFLGTALLNAQRDGDGDGFPDAEDNCPTRWNPEQVDDDVDGLGDWCDADYPPVAIGLTASHTTRPEGSRFIFRFERFFDPGNHGHVDVTWQTDLTMVDDWGSTAYSKGKWVSYADEGEYQMTVTLTNAVDNARQYTWNATVTNVAPVITIHGASEATAGTPMTLYLNIKDAGWRDVVTYSINWGDGTPLENDLCDSLDPCDHVLPMERTHTYATRGERRIRVTAQDEDGGMRRRSLILTVE